MLTLYFTPGASSLAPHIVLCEAGLQARLVKVDLGSKQTEDGADFRTINPKGYVPALKLEDGQVLTEVPAIMQYVADRGSNKGLLPAPGTMERYRLVEWMNYISAELHKGLGSLFNPAMTEAWKNTAKEQLATRLQYLSEQLGNKPYLLGEAFTVVDAYLFTVLGWGRYVDFDLSRWPNLIAFSARVAGREGVQRVLREEGLI